MISAAILLSQGVLPWSFHPPRFYLCSSPLLLQFITIHSGNQGLSEINFFSLSASFFYACGEPIYILLLLFSILAGWLAARAIGSSLDPKFRKKILIADVSFHVLLLFVFKYLTFTITQLGLLLHTSLINLQIALPLGISFFTFQILSYVFDVYYQKVPVQKNFFDIALYVALFPQLVAGPIVRYSSIMNEIRTRAESWDLFSDGMLRFIYGLAKKVLIANYMAQVADNIFDYGTPESMATAWLGAIAYTLQIYFDFSGYSDMAIGLGLMFGFHFPENFNYPYISKSATKFWRRWHMTLGSWFRDYVYIPLGGNRVSPARHILNLFIVWALTGVWHGANWTFLCWGLFYFILLVIEKETGFTKKIGPFAQYALAAIILGWTLFRSPNISFAASYIAVMLNPASGSLVDSFFWEYLRGSWTVLIPALLLSLPLYPWLQGRIKCHSPLPIVESICSAALFVLCLIVATGSSYNPFIYFNF